MKGKKIHVVELDQGTTGAIQGEVAQALAAFFWERKASKEGEASEERKASKVGKASGEGKGRGEMDG